MPPNLHAGRRPPEAAPAGWLRLAPLVLVLAAVAAYANSFQGVFLYDDAGSIADNPTIRELGSPAVFAPPAAPVQTVSGRPVLNVSFAVNHALGGVDPWGYHAVNLAIHAMAALLLFGIVRRTLRRRPPGAWWLPGDEAGSRFAALAAAMLWLLHPLQTGSVTYVVQRAESQMGMFLLLTLYALVRATEPGTRPRRWLAVSVAAAWLGAGTKEVMAVAPVLVLLYDRAFVAGSLAAAWRDRRGYYAALASVWVWIAAAVLSLGGNRGGSMGGGIGIGWVEQWLTQFPALVRYLRLAFWPHPLVFDYGVERVPGPGSIVPEIALVAGLLVLTLVALRRWPAAGFLGSWFFLILAPSSAMPSPMQTTAEHRMYLPLAALLVLGVAVLFRGAGRAGLGAGLVLALAGGGLTHARNRDYHSARGMWADTVAKRPANAVARYNYGHVLAAEGRLAEAQVQYEAALRIKAGRGTTAEHNNLASVLMGLGRPREALPHYEAALRQGGDPIQLGYNLGLALHAAGEPEPALAQLESVTRAAPANVPAWNMQGVVLVALGRLPEAVARYEEALRREPGAAEVCNNLGLALLRLDRLDEAVVQLERAVVLKPDLPEYQSNLGIALARAGRPGEAAARFRTALALRPADLDTRLKLGVVLAQAGRLDEALAAYEEATRVAPGSAAAHQGAAEILSRMPGREAEAARHRAEIRRLRGEP